MGIYINKLPDGTRLGMDTKSEEILAAGVGIETKRPARFADIPAGKTLVAIVYNPPWEAAMVCDTPYDYLRTKPNNYDPRPVRFFYIDTDKIDSMADIPVIERNYESKAKRSHKV